MTSSLMRRSTAADLYRFALSAQYAPGQRIWDPSYSSAKDPEVYEKVRLNPILDGSIDRALTAVAGKQWSWEPGGESEVDKQAAKVFNGLTKKIRRMAEGIKSLAEARFTGSAYAFVKGDFTYDSIGETAARRWWIPRWLQHVDRRRMMAVARDAGDEFSVEWQMWSVKRRQMEKIERPEWFIRHVLIDQESTLGYGRGEIDSLYLFKFAFDKVLEEGLAGIVRWARGQVVVQIDNARDASKTNSGETLATEALAMIEAMAAKYGIVLDKTDTVTVLPGPGQGHQMVTDFLEWLTKWMIIRIEGSYLPSGGGGEGGAYGLGKEQANTTEGKVISFQRVAIEDTITADLGGLLWRLNMPTLLEVSPQFAVAQQPRFTISPEKVEDPAKNATVVETLSRAGFRMKLSEIAQKTGFTVPSAEDVAKGDVLEPRAAPDPFGGGARTMDDLDQLLGATPSAQAKSSTRKRRPAAARR